MQKYVQKEGAYMEQQYIKGPVQEFKNSQPRNGLSYDDAVLRVQKILDDAAAGDMSEDELRDELTAAGFAGDAADIDDCGEAGFKIRIWGPGNTPIDL